MPDATKHKPRIVLVNGLYGAPEHFDALRRSLDPAVRTDVFTLRRQGQPDPTPQSGFRPLVARLDAIVGATDDRPLLLGFSLGGAVALEYALEHGNRLSGLVLVNSFARFEGDPLQTGSMPALRMWPQAWSHPGMMARVVHRVDWMRRGLFHRDATADVIEQGFRAAIGSMNQEDVRYQLAHLRLPIPPDLPARLIALPVKLPVWLVSSRDDLIVPSRHTRRLAAWMPAARNLEPIEGGHAFFQHDGRVMAALVNEFLAHARPTNGGAPEGPR